MEPAVRRTWATGRSSIGYRGRRCLYCSRICQQRAHRLRSKERLWHASGGALLPRLEKSGRVRPHVAQFGWHAIQAIQVAARRRHKGPFDAMPV